MKDVIGMILVIIGALGFIGLTAIGIYSVCGWIGLVAFLCVISFLIGMELLDDWRF